MLMDKANDRHRWGIVLAGGDGTRLRSLTRLITGDERPKQFCRILGDDSLLGRTLKRVKYGISEGNILISVTQTHASFYDYLFDEFDSTRLVEQPANLGTAPAILYSLIRVAKRDPEAYVTFFPSDHYLSDDREFMRQVDAAFTGVEQHPGMIALLGIAPASPETEYGWIEPEPAADIASESPLLKVKRFWEKPGRSKARELLDRGCLWNSFVMTGKVTDFLTIIARSVPVLYHEFMGASHLIGTPAESDAIDYVYEKLTPVNFSQRVLEPSTENLLTLMVKDVQWSDLGDPARVISTLENIGVKTAWSQTMDDASLKTA